MAYAFNDDKSKVDVYSKTESDNLLSNKIKTFRLRTTDANTYTQKEFSYNTLGLQAGVNYVGYGTRSVMENGTQYPLQQVSCNTSTSKVLVVYGATMPANKKVETLFVFIKM